MGKNISDADRERVFAVAEEKGIVMYDQKDDFEKMSVIYEEL